MLTFNTEEKVEKIFKLSNLLIQVKSNERLIKNNHLKKVAVSLQKQDAYSHIT